MSKYTKADLEDTIVAISTPAGVGAIGVVRMSGPMAINICNAVFKGKNLYKQPSHTVHFGTIRDKNRIIDEVLVSLFKAPRSYTSDDTVEISCHGSPYILQEIVSLFVKKGARLAKAGEFTMRAFLNGRLDLSQAEAIADLIASQSAASHQLAMQQMRGGYSNEISVLRDRLIHFASLIELELDFGEEDVEFANREQLITLIDDIQSLLKKLITSFSLGNAMKHGVTTVIAGRPNAGKSTLLNALLNEDRAIVSEIAGTTRDTIEEIVNINGIQFRFIDTAGIREASDTIEAIGVQKTMEKLRQSAIVLYVFDVNELTAETLQEDLDKLQLENIPTLLIGNKIDDTKKEFETVFAKHDNLLFLSAKAKQNIEELKQQLQDLILNNKVIIGDTIVSNVRHFEALTQANDALEAVLNGVSGHISGELLALDIRTSLHHLGEITGEVTTDDLLGNIFSNFCIGK